MSLVETEGLVLKSYGLSEADKIVVLLTRTEGLVRGVARGAKRLKSRFGGSLEVSSIVQITYFQKEERELVSIRNVELIKSYFEAASEPRFFENFAYMVEILTGFAAPHDPNERLYRMAKSCLDAAREKPQDFDAVIVYFDIWTLRLGGFLPDWTKCNNCKKQLSADENTGLHINFNLICQTCQKAKNGWIVSPEQRRVFMLAQRISPDKFIELAADRNESLGELSVILKRIISNILGREVSAAGKAAANP